MIELVDTHPGVEGQELDSHHRCEGSVEGRKVYREAAGSPEGVEVATQNGAEDGNDDGVVIGEVALGEKGHQERHTGQRQRQRLARIEEKGACQNVDGIEMIPDQIGR